jgi:hypothetical protein
MLGVKPLFTLFKFTVSLVPTKGDTEKANKIKSWRKNWRKQQDRLTAYIYKIEIAFSCKRNNKLQELVSLNVTFSIAQSLLYEKSTKLCITAFIIHVLNTLLPSVVLLNVVAPFHRLFSEGSWNRKTFFQLFNDNSLCGGAYRGSDHNFFKR